MHLKKLIVLLSCFGSALCGAQAFAASTPVVVEKLAQAYVKAHAGADNAAAQRAMADTYAATFFIGYLQHNGGIWNAPALESAAYTDGQAYGRAHPGERDAILLGYGYERVEVDGVWERGFELSKFVPADRPPEEWWLSSYGGVAWHDLGLGQQIPSFNKARVHIVGYASSIGRHGHLGMYQRDVLVTAFHLDSVVRLY
ncbi:MAG: hypothetical protein V4582_22795 [Pseudomonadota bacterium]